jgi:hypothetical protein
MQIRFKLNGRELKESSVEISVEEATLAETKEQLTAKLAGVRCPEHNRPPLLEFEGDCLKTLKVRVEACCETLRSFSVSALNSN